MKLAILGAGRMGRALLEAIHQVPDVELAGVWARSGSITGDMAASSAPVSTDLDQILRFADAAVDFTLPAATAEILDAALRHRTPLVCGVTGLPDVLVTRLAAAARSIPVLYDRNMSTGIAVLADLVARAAERLGPGFAASIHETHHVSKKDAPSGTALQLGEALARARCQDFRKVYRFAPGGASSRRSQDEIVVTAERRGDVPGEHQVCLASASEQLTLGHSVTDRRVFAEGALRAARWLVPRSAGLYAMRDVVRLPADGSEGSRDSVK